MVQRDDLMVLTFLCLRSEKDSIFFEEARQLLKCPCGSVDDLYEIYLKFIRNQRPQMTNEEYEHLYNLLEESFMRKIADEINYKKGEYYDFSGYGSRWYSNVLNMSVRVAHLLGRARIEPGMLLPLEEEQIREYFRKNDTWQIGSKLVNQIVEKISTYKLRHHK